MKEVKKEPDPGAQLKHTGRKEESRSLKDSCAWRD